MPPIETSDSGNESSCTEEEEDEVDLESDDEISADEEDEVADEDSYQVKIWEMAF